MLRSLVMASLLALTACDKASADQTRGPQAPDVTPGEPSPVDTRAPPSEGEPPAAVVEPAPPPAPTYGPAALTMLTEAQRNLLAAGEEDAPIQVETHYIQSNEQRHDLFFPYIDGIGGCAVGVGSDQTFTVAAKARASFLFMMDIDRQVVDLHHMHRVFILASATPEENWGWWDASKAEEAKALLAEKLPEYGADPATAKRTLRSYPAFRETVYRHLRRVITRERNGKPVTWLSDPELYAHVRALYQTGRVRIMQGNLAGAHSMRTAASACRELGETMRVLYMSNAEEYFEYTPDFVSNIRAQPIDDQSVVLRTIYSKKWEHADLWAYQVHALPDFLERLRDRRNRKRSTMLRLILRDGGMERESLGIEGFSRIGYEGEATAP